MINYYDPKRVSIDKGISMIPNSINYILSESLMVLRIYTNKKKRVVKLSKINGEILISSVELQKYIKELIE